MEHVGYPALHEQRTAHDRIAEEFTTAASEFIADREASLRLLFSPVSELLEDHIENADRRFAEYLVERPEPL